MSLRRKLNELMAKWNILNQSGPENELRFFRIVYHPDMVFGVTAASAEKAEALVCEEVFHNQTIPGFPEIEALSMEQIKSNFPVVSLEKVKEEGIWYSS